MRMPVLAANWKMHKSLHDATSYVRELGVLARGAEGVEIVVAPPFTALAASAEVARNTEIGIAAQNISAEPEGAFTGEVSAAMVADAGAEYVLVGHSERRRLFGETDALVSRKLRAALGATLIPIACIGETLDERERGETTAVLDRQIKVGFDGLTADEIAALIVAYEPVWAIGTGRNAAPEEAGEVHAHIRGRLRQWFGGAAADQTRLIYGGSVKPDNIASLTSLPEVDGALVGGASLEVRTFWDIVQKSVP